MLDPIMLWVTTNDDPNLSCMLCGRAEHIPRPLVTTYYTPQGRVLAGIHQDCYDRARVPIGPLSLPEPSERVRPDIEQFEEVEACAGDSNQVRLGRLTVRPVRGRTEAMR